ncbi:MAG: hypothetical protein H0S85_11165 [Desulfovibrionaceae bacterium]|jgi:hypothetical protein|nr:hypothetical protein [Desulfovibrionaceae bacterium]
MDYHDILLNEKSLISIYDDPSDYSSLNIGFVDFVDEEYIRIKSISSFGRNDGFLTLKVSSIHRIDKGGIYEGTLLSLYDKYGSDFEHVFEQGLSAFNQSLELGKNKLCCLHDIEHDKYTSGFIVSYDIDNITINEVDRYGRPVGQATINAQDISRIELLSEQTQARQYLFDLNGPHATKR